ncbi:MAG: hypothetical protein KC613_12640, partial [Myxococcales bacterium]|nr:hypothetical protein [Myxococcales bacterium]
ALLPDAGPPPACPPEPPFGACGNAERACGYGAPFTCCVREYEHRTLCRCEGGTWICEDRRETCLADAAGAGCLRRVEVCEAWGRILADRQADVDGAFRAGWDGSVAGCAPGDMPAEWRQRAFDRLNDWRYLAGQPPARLSPDRNVLAQHCALAMHARGFWTHDLTPEDPCYSEQARQGAAESLVSMRGIAVDVLWNYVEDFGEMNFAAAPHRLWMFSNRLGPVGIGATDDATCMHVANARLESDKAYIPWPAAGPFPADAVLGDALGWTIQSDTINFNGATVRVTRDGDPMPVEVRVLQAQYGAAHALAFKPDGWAPQAGESYLVVVAGASQPVRYAVEFIDCAAE